MAQINITISEGTVKKYCAQFGLTEKDLARAFHQFMDECIGFDEFDIWLDTNLSDYLEDEQ